MPELEPVIVPNSKPAADTKAVVDQIEGFLKEALLQLPPEPAHKGRGRPKVLPSVCLCAGLLVCLLRGFTSQLAIWRLLHQADFWLQPALAWFLDTTKTDLSNIPVFLTTSTLWH